MVVHWSTFVKRSCWAHLRFPCERYSENSIHTLWITSELRVRLQGGGHYAHLVGSQMTPPRFDSRLTL
jgi:hypothetical protein